MIKIWDTCGQEQFRSLTANYFRNAEGIVLVYDVTEDNSFKSLKGWVESIVEKGKEDVPKIVIGNKIDFDKKVISTKQAKQFTDSNKIKLFEASAKKNINVMEAFNFLFTEIAKSKQTKVNRLGSIRISKIIQTEKKFCEKC